MSEASTASDLKKHSVDSVPPADQRIVFEPSTQEFLDSLGSTDPVDPRVDGIEAFRASARELQLTHTCAVSDGVEIENQKITGRNGSVPVRLYRGQGSTAHAPLLVYLHGGGWVVGGLDECDGVCSYISQHAGVTVISVDYRMAPEHKFPAAVEDSFDVVSWAAENMSVLGGLPGKLGVAGDSAGGNLAAVVCQQAKAIIDLEISRQILIYPCLAPGDHAKHPSRLAYGGENSFLSESALAYMVELYRRNSADETDPRFWPTLYDDFTGLPSTYIITAEYDMLRDEGRAYGEALSDSGVAVEYKDYIGTVHGFFCFAGTVEPGRRALSELCAYLRNW